MRCLVKERKVAGLATCHPSINGWEGYGSERRVMGSASHVLCSRYTGPLTRLLPIRPLCYGESSLFLDSTSILQQFIRFLSRNLYGPFIGLFICFCCFLIGFNLKLPFRHYLHQQKNHRISPPHLLDPRRKA